jgi:hypothetical protein
MASAYSKPKQFDNYVEPVNLELVNFVLGSKEQKFNYNIAKVEQTLQDFGQLGLIRDQDKEYLADRVNTMLTQMGDIENADWSDSNIERQISTGIRGSIDGKVRNDIQMSRNYKNYMKQVQAAKEKDDGSYNDVNYAMGLKNAGADKWISGETDKMGKLNYMPYVDYTTKMNDVIKDRIKTHGTEVVESVPQGDGTTVNVTKEVLTPDTIRTLWKANMTPEMQVQMQMEADFKFSGQGEQVQSQVIEGYKENIVREQKQTKQNLDKLNLELKGTSDKREKALIQQKIEYLNSENEGLTEELESDISYKKAYLSSYFKGTREEMVDANAFDRVTDIELNYDALKVLKLKRDLLKTEKTDAESVSETYAKTTDPTILADKAAETVYERTERTMKTSVDEFSIAMTQNTNFKDSYDISLEEFNAKSQEEKLSFATTAMKKIVNGKIDLDAERVYSGAEINAAKKYAASKGVFDQVNTDIKTTTDRISKESYKAMSNGVANNSISVGNIIIPAIKEAITSGKKFNELNSDQQNAFRVAMIDETFRRTDIGDGIKPYILTQREELLKGIKSEKIKKQFSTSEIISENVRGSLGANIRAGLHAGAGVLDSFAEGIGSVFGATPSDRPSKSFERAGEFVKEANQIGTPYSLLQNDEGIKELQGNEFIIDGKPTNALSYIKNQYKGVTESAELIALQATPNLMSTSALMINPNIKGQEEMFNRGSTYLASDNSASIDDFRKSEMYMRVNPDDNTVIFSSKLSRAAAKDYFDGEVPNDRMLHSDPIPVDQIGDMDEIMSRLKTDQEEWVLNSKNKYAQNLEFKMSGFETKGQRKKTVEGVLDKVPSDYRLGLSQRPQSLGLTYTEMETFAEDANRTTKQGEQKSLKQEFPNAYNYLTTGKGKFEISYKSKHNQGYFMDVSYVVNEKEIPIKNDYYTGDTTLNADRSYLEAYQEQTESFLSIVQGYSQNNSEFINILKEIDKING